MTLRVAVHDLGGHGPLLVLGPSLGTSAHRLWGPAAERLTESFRVLAWDLPGHGASPSATRFDLAGLAGAVVTGVDERAGGDRFAYAGVSVGGAVGLHLLLDNPERVGSAVLLCTGARIGDPESWRARAASVRAEGTRTLLNDTPGRWFGPGFAEQEPTLARGLLDDLAGADDESYAAVCEALATYDVRPDLSRVAAPVLAVAGERDPVTPPSSLRHIAGGVPHGRLAVLDGVAHLAPAEAPDRVAALVAEHVTAGSPSAREESRVRAEGMRVRREVLGDDHVDRASAGTTPFTADFQDLITRYAWGDIWTRPGLDRRSRSMVTLTALVARGHHEELAMHVRAARTNGLTAEEIKEVLLQTAIYYGVPDANAAFRIASRMLDELGPDTHSEAEPTSET